MKPFLSSSKNSLFSHTFPMGTQSVLWGLEEMFSVNQKVMVRHEGIFRNAQIERVQEVLVPRTGEASSSGSMSTSQGSSSSSSLIPISGNGSGNGNGMMTVTKYYVHWFDFDRRLDQWVAESEIAPMVNVNKAAKAQQTKGGTVTTRQMAQQRGVTVSDSVFVPPPPLKGNAGVPGRRYGSGDSKFFYLPKNVMTIFMGQWEVPAWYFSPYMLARPTVRSGLDETVLRMSVNPNTALNLRSSPVAPELVGNTPQSPLSANTALGLGTSLHICPYCAASFLCEDDVKRHVDLRCKRHPPGREVYRDTLNQFIVFEVDGAIERIFCEDLALLSKLFLEHKFIDYDMTPFVFYVLCVLDKDGCEIAAYFSKEKRSPDNYNLSCILSLPQYQGKGYGRFLVEMSYEMSKREGKPGTPERPLSDLGERLYHAFWADAVLDVVANHKLHGQRGGHWVLPPLTIERITKETGIILSDISLVMKNLKMLNRSSDGFQLSEVAAREHEMARLQRAALGKPAFYPQFLVWSPNQYSLVQVPADAVAVVNPVVSETSGRKRPRE
jgi:histone acetyltransferase HTATIP